jgi:hypothetical protein
VFTARELATLVAAFSAANEGAPEEETAAFVAWATRVRVEGAMLALIFRGHALPGRPDGAGGYQLRAAP